MVLFSWFTYFSHLRLCRRAYLLRILPLPYTTSLPHHSPHIPTAAAQRLCATIKYHRLGTVFLRWSLPSLCREPFGHCFAAFSAVTAILTLHYTACCLAGSAWQRLPVYPSALLPRLLTPVCPPFFLRAISFFFLMEPPAAQVPARFLRNNSSYTIPLCSTAATLCLHICLHLPFNSVMGLGFLLDAHLYRLTCL